MDCKIRINFINYLIKQNSRKYIIDIRDILKYLFICKLNILNYKNYKINIDFHYLENNNCHIKCNYNNLCIVHNILAHPYNKSKFQNLNIKFREYIWDKFNLYNLNTLLIKRCSRCLIMYLNFQNILPCKFRTFINCNNYNREKHPSK